MKENGLLIKKKKNLLRPITVDFCAYVYARGERFNTLLHLSGLNNNFLNRIFPSLIELQIRHRFLFCILCDDFYGQVFFFFFISDENIYLSF